VIPEQTDSEREAALFGDGVDESGDGRIYRRGTSAEAKEALRRQFRFLPKFREVLPVPVPAPEALVDDVLIYRKLRGTVMAADAHLSFDTRELARDIAHFMQALHTLSVEDCLMWGVSERDRTEVLLSAFERVMPHLPVQERQWAEAWRGGFDKGEYRAVVVHGDLWYENLLVDPETYRLAGVIDFDTTSLGDPAWDLATQLHCGVGFAQLVFDAYGDDDPEMWTRAQRLFQLRQFEGLDWAIRQGDAVEFEESIAKLRSAGVLGARRDT